MGGLAAIATPDINMVKLSREITQGWSAAQVSRLFSEASLQTCLGKDALGGSDVVGNTLITWAHIETAALSLQRGSPK